MTTINNSSKSNNIIVLGDVHADIDHCVSVANQHPDKTIVQIGDLGAGHCPTDFLINTLPQNFKFFVGNHDSRQEAKKIPNNLGDFGEINDKVFFVSGAESIDKHGRTLGVDYWDDEQLSYAQAQACLDLWSKSSCRIILAHECPQSILQNYYLKYHKNLTRSLLDRMIGIRPPELFVFGHHHKSVKIHEKNTTYIGLRINETYEIKL